MHDDSKCLQRRTIAAALAELGFDAGADLRYELVQGGGSGSSVVRVWVAGACWILKLSGASAAPVLRARAQREIAFYRSLAPRVPLLTPRVVGSYVHVAGDSAVLIEAYSPSPPAARWAAGDYCEAAAQLARMHAAFWNRASELEALPWLRRRDDSGVPTLDAARAAWQPLWPRLGELGLAAGVPALLGSAVSTLQHLAAKLQSLPWTLCHGDCHIGNLLRDAQGRLVWADWQEVGAGHGPRDCSFLVQRAMADGAAVPEELLFETYTGRLAQALGAPVSATALREAADAFELRTRLLEWPVYLAAAPPAPIMAHLARIELLLSRSPAAATRR